MADRPNPQQPLNARRRILRRMMTAAVIACVTVGSGSGCSMLGGLSQSDAIDEFMVGYRNQAWSARSWHQNKDKFCNQAHNRDFAAGYRQGYEDVAAGGNGCTPAMPPRAYWGWRYQSPEGQAKVSAWFAGYPHGAKAAEMEGLGSWSEIRTMLPAHETMPPAVIGPEGLPHETAPTPLEGLGPMGNGPLDVPAADFGSIDFSSIKRVSAANVPTAASGR